MDPTEAPFDHASYSNYMYTNTSPNQQPVSGNLMPGVTPYFSDQMNESHFFENEYSNNFSSPAAYGSNGSTSFHDMYDRDISQGAIDGTTFDPQMMLSFKGREYSQGSSDSNSNASPSEPYARQLPVKYSSANPEPVEAGPAFHDKVSSVKRNRFLERNRLAAAKCRTKKKEWTNNLEAAARQASQQTRELHAIVQNLRNEVQEHRALLESHQGCQCQPVQDYLMRGSDR